MATRADVMAYANIKPCELPEGDHIGAVPEMPGATPEEGADERTLS